MRPLNDREYIGLTLYGEARGESLEGKVAVANVLKNRVQSGRWGKNYEAVTLAPKQFSCWNGNDPNLPKLRALADALSDGITPSDPALGACLWVADGLLGGHLPNPVQDATHYFAVSMKDAPAWSRSGEFVARVGNHLFFAKVK